MCVILHICTGSNTCYIYCMCITKKNNYTPKCHYLYVSACISCVSLFFIYKNLACRLMHGDNVMGTIWGSCCSMHSQGPLCGAKLLHHLKLLYILAIYAIHQITLPPLKRSWSPKYHFESYNFPNVKSDHPQCCIKKNSYQYCKLESLYSMSTCSQNLCIKRGIPIDIL